MLATRCRAQGIGPDASGRGSSRVGQRTDGDDEDDEEEGHSAVHLPVLVHVQRPVHGPRFQVEIRKRCPTTNTLAGGAGMSAAVLAWRALGSSSRDLGEGDLAISEAQASPVQTCPNL